MSPSTSPVGPARAPLTPRPAPRAPRLGYWLLVGLALMALALLLAPVVYRLLVDLGWLNPARGRGGDPFGRVLRRMLLVPVAVVVFVGLKPWRDVSALEMGLVGPRARRGTGWIAFLLTLGAMLALLSLHVGLGWLRMHIDEGAGVVAWRVVKTLGTAGVVACLEEWFFRAWLPLRLSRRWDGWRGASAVSVLVFAGLHAFRATGLSDPVEPSLAGALQALRTWFSTLIDPTAFGPAFLGLLLLGWLLTVAYRRTGTLWASIGIHAAGIWVLQSYGAFTQRLATPSWAGTKVLYDGVPGWLLLLAVIALWGRRPARLPGAGSTSGADGVPPSTSAACAAPRD